MGDYAMSNYGVHMSHCCNRHGCKYSDADCPVVFGIVTAKYKQECCEYTTAYDLKIAMDVVLDWYWYDIEPRGFKYIPASRNNLNLTEQVEKYIKEYVLPRSYTDGHKKSGG